MFMERPPRDRLELSPSRPLMPAKQPPQNDRKAEAICRSLQRDAFSEAGKRRNV
jgi:hypothetical protein